MNKILITISLIAVCFIVLMAGCTKKPEAFFIYEIVAGSCDLSTDPGCKDVIFTNLSKNAHSIQWSYTPCVAGNPGECYFSMQNPIVTVATPSIFTMTLTAYPKRGKKINTYSVVIDTN